MLSTTVLALGLTNHSTLYLRRIYGRRVILEAFVIRHVKATQHDNIMHGSITKVLEDLRLGRRWRLKASPATLPILNLSSGGQKIFSSRLPIRPHGFVGYYPNLPSHYPFLLG
jgi:hypothetical protein